MLPPVVMAVLGCTVGVERPSLLTEEDEPAGANCPFGGVALRSGVDVDGDGRLDGAGEARTATYVCHAMLTAVDEVASGSNCQYGGRAFRRGVDSNGDGRLDSPEVDPDGGTSFQCNLYPTRWAATTSALQGNEVPPSFYLPTGHEVAIELRSAARLKVTVSDTLGVGLGLAYDAGDPQGAAGAYEVRMNGEELTPRCVSSREVRFGRGQNDLVLPFALTCLTSELPRGVYRFEVYFRSSLGLTVRGRDHGQPLLLVQEMPASTQVSRSPFGPEPPVTFEMSDAGSVAVPGRSLTYRKKLGDESVLKVTLVDVLRLGVDVTTATSAQVSIRVAKNGGPRLPTGCGVSHGDGSADVASTLSDPFVMTCVMSDLPSGDYELDTWLTSTSNHPLARIGSPYWYPLLMVEEVPVGGRDFAVATEESTPVFPAGRWERVMTPSGPYLTRSHRAGPSTTKVLVTYSDTFQGAMCNGRQGLVGVREDDRATSCWTSVTSRAVDASPGGGFVSAQQHHWPIHLVCVLPVEGGSTHTYSLWTTVTGELGAGDPSCSNRLGGGERQRLLLIEDLP